MGGRLKDLVEPNRRHKKEKVTDKCFIYQNTKS